MASTTDTASTTRPKFDWYETDQQIVINVLVKNLKADAVKVAFTPRTVTFTYSPEENSGQKLELSLNLHGSISTSESSYRVSSVKAEIKLRKVANFRWGKLEAENDTDSSPLTTPAPPMASISGDLADKAVTAITSAQSKLKSWEEQIKQVEEEEKDQGGVEQLFRQIYSTSSPEVQRAMNKSFQESNGTVLSTNWEEVCKGKVEMKPPEDQEFKKW